ARCRVVRENGARERLLAEASRRCVGPQQGYDLRMDSRGEAQGGREGVGGQGGASRDPADENWRHAGARGRPWSRGSRGPEAGRTRQGAGVIGLTSSTRLRALSFTDLQDRSPPHLPWVPSEPLRGVRRPLGVPDPAPVYPLASDSVWKPRSSRRAIATC